jgi:hypothetical protein
MTDIDLRLSEQVVAVIVVWIVLYASDYYLTLAGARLCRGAGNRHLVHEGSYELTPAFQQDVDGLRLVSRSLLFYLALSSAAIYLVWWLGQRTPGGPQIYALLVGALYLREAAVFVRHFRSIAMFSVTRDGQGVEGQVRYRRWLGFWLSGADLLIFAGLFLFLFLLMGSWFMLGGVFGCLVIGLRHLWSARGLRRAALESE